MSYVGKGHHVKLTPGFYLDRGTKVEIDGVEVQQVVDIQFQHRVDGVATLYLTLYPASFELEGKVDKIVEDKIVEEKAP